MFIITSINQLFLNTVKCITNRKSACTVQLINTIHSLMFLVVGSGGSRSAVQDIQPCHNLERNSQLFFYIDRSLYNIAV